MQDNIDLISLHKTCELAPRYQNLMAAFRQATGRENLEQVQTYLLFLLVARRMLAEEQAIFDRYNLSEGKLSVLLLLKNHPQGQITPSEIAAATGVSRATVTGLLAGLERDGYILRSDDPSDKRRCTIQLTGRSCEVVESLLQERFQHIEELLAEFTPAEQNALRAAIEKLNSHLSPAVQP